ncbi:MAG: PadR family transcriptional regulator [Nocardioidaceae bacterium]
MSKRRVSNLLALAVLACLVEKPMHPYEISTTLRTRGKENSIKLNYGSLYSVVDALAKRGLIEAQQTVRDGRRPERTVYAITPDGRAEFEDWLAELVSTPVREYTSLEAGLSLLAGLSPDESARLLTERAGRLRIELGAIDSVLAVTSEQGLPELFVIEEHYRRARLVAEIAFVVELADRIRTEKLPGVQWWRRISELREQGVTVQEIYADPLRHLGEEGAAMLAQLDQTN